MRQHSLKKTTANNSTPKGAIIQSLQRGLGILEIVAKSEMGATAAEVSRQIGLHVSTTSHLLRTLTTLGYLAQDEVTRQYHIGSKPFRVAASAWSEVQLFRMAKPLLAEMAHQTGETSHLAVLERDEVIVIGKIDGSSRVAVSERVGYPRPAHCTAIGKVLLAHLSDAELKAFLSMAELRRSTPRTVVAVPVFEQELARVKGQGYAFDDEEFTQGIRCLAAPVRNYTGHVVAAIGISGPVWRVSLDRVAQLTEFVKAVGHRLSEELGYKKDQANNVDHPRVP